MGPTRPTSARSTRATCPSGRGSAPPPTARAASPGVGELMPEDEFLGLLAAVDDFGLVRLGTPEASAIADKLARHPLAEHFDLEKVAAAAGDAEAVAAEKGAMPLHLGADHLAAAVRRAHESDAALTADVFFENLAGKASATLALLRVLARQRHRPGLDRLRHRLRRGGDRRPLPARRRQPRQGRGGGRRLRQRLRLRRQELLRRAAPRARDRQQPREGRGLPAGRGRRGRLAAEGRDEVPGPPQARPAGARGRARRSGADRRGRRRPVAAGSASTPSGKHPVAAGSSNPKIMEALVVRAARPPEAEARPTSTTTRPSCTTRRSPSRRARATSRSATTRRSPRWRCGAATSAARTWATSSRTAGMPGFAPDAGAHRLGAVLRAARAGTTDGRWRRATRPADRQGQSVPGTHVRAVGRDERAA